MYLDFLFLVVNGYYLALGSDAINKPNYIWVNKDPMNYIAWAPLSHLPANGNCMYLASTGWWNLDCSILKPFLCEQK